MKKTFFLALAILTTTLVSAQKIGYCNSIALLQEMQEVKQADSDLQAYQSQLVKRGEEMVKNLQTKAGDLQRKKDAGTISPKDFETESQKLEKDQADIQKYEQEVMEKLGNKREELYQPILEKVNKAIEEVAKAKGYLLIIDASQQVLLFADESLDVTKDVKAKLGMAN